MPIILGILLFGVLAYLPDVLYLLVDVIQYVVGAAVVLFFVYAALKSK